MKSYFTFAFFTIIALISCSNDDDKIKELESKLEQQQQDLNQQKQEQLEQKIDSQEKQIESLKTKDDRVQPRKAFFARGAGLFPEASERRLVYEDLIDLTGRDLKIMRNEIYARHGYIFKTNDMIDYFSNQQWYEPVNKDVTSMLTNIEKENAEYIKNYE